MLEGLKIRDCFFIFTLFLPCLSTSVKLMFDQPIRKSSALLEVESRWIEDPLFTSEASE